MQRWHDCTCEDFPCCGHYDTMDAGPPDPCDYCGTIHAATFDCSYDSDEDDWEDDEDLRDCDCGNPDCMICNGDRDRNERQRYNAFGQKIRAGAPELPGDHYGDDPFDERDYT